ncbi:B3 domain-containing protein REM16-like [Salvia divinorum]|uniref:B3 domain-containing protein REM16-like n=1 Tax=Salvia divinorum TaxID=28513 RepID=A0ABD1FV84_SALDI
MSSPTKEVREGNKGGGAFSGVVAPLVLRHDDKQWQTTFLGEKKRSWFECSDWKRFVDDNNMAEGDDCIFERESSISLALYPCTTCKSPRPPPPQPSAPLEKKKIDAGIGPSTDF